MHPFETIGEDGKTYFHYENWHKWRHDRFTERPCPELQFRFDIEIAYPCDTIEEVMKIWPARNRIYYECDKWGVMDGPYEAHLEHEHHKSINYRLLVESGYKKGEQITLFGDCSNIQNEPWGRYHGTKYCYYRGKYWAIVHNEFCSEWRPKIYYPLSSCDPIHWQEPYQKVILDWLLDRYPYAALDTIYDNLSYVNSSSLSVIIPNLKACCRACIYGIWDRNCGDILKIEVSSIKRDLISFDHRGNRYVNYHEPKLRLYWTSLLLHDPIFFTKLEAVLEELIGEQITTESIDYAESLMLETMMHRNIGVVEVSNDAC